MLKALLVLCACNVVLLPVTGCNRLACLFGAKREQQITPRDFSSDPHTRQLAMAVDKADPQEIASVVRAGADVDAIGAAGFRLLDWAMARNNVRGFEALLSQGASLHAVFKDPRSVPNRSYNQTILERVIGVGHDEFLRVVLRSGVAPDYVPHPENGRSLLFIAADAKALHAIDVLLEAGAAIDHQDMSGETALFDAMLARDYTTAWHLLKRGADPTIKTSSGRDLVWGLRQWGSRGVRPEHREGFEAIVAELERRGLLTRQDIVEADKPKPSTLGGLPGVTVIEHSRDSEAGRAIRELDQREREANRRQDR